MNRRQIDNLVEKQFPGIELFSFRVKLQLLHKPLQLFAKLKQNQKILAESTSGLSIGKMTEEQRIAFYKFAGVGMPSIQKISEKKTGFYFQRISNGKKNETIRFISVIGNKTQIQTVYEFSVQANKLN